jgi:manganese/zinc/iron transport system substrate-binding protein
MGEVFEQMGRRGVTTIAVAECVPGERLIEAGDFGGVHDPHVWFDVMLWTEGAACVRDALVELDPAHAAGYESRAAAYFEELIDLDGWIRKQVASIPPESRVLVTAHDAFSYFGRAYGIEVRGLLGISTVAEAGAADVQELASFIAERRLPAVFVETSVPERYVTALTEAVVARGHQVTIGGSLYSDALGDKGTEAATYVGTVRANVRTIVAALAGGDA